jgi:hypothetical protein
MSPQTLVAFIPKYTVLPGTHNSVIGCDAMLRTGMSRFRVQMRSLNFINLPNPFSRTRPWAVLNL